MNYGLQAVAHLYNTSMAGNNGKNNAVYNFKQHIAKNRSEGITKIGVLDVERGVLDCASEEPWQDDTSIGDWYYHSDAPYKSAESIVGTLVDITAKNGNLLLNVLQRPDGTIDDQVLYELEKIGGWMKQNGEGIFGTRPYKKAEEGGTNLSGGAFKENEASWRPSDYRFTKKDDSVFAFWMNGKGEHTAVIKSLGRLYENEVKAVSIRGRKSGFVQKDGALIVNVQESIADSMPVCIKIDI